MSKRFGLLCGFALLSLAMPLSMFAQSVLRGPYLQSLSNSSVIIRWRTDIATNSRVRFGPAPDQLNTVVDNPAVVTEHEVSVTGLSPYTTYYYSFGTTLGMLGGANADHYFVTAPTAGSSIPVRIWTFGDAQEGSAAAREAVRDAYYKFTAGTRTDIMLLLGDNATFENIPTDEIYTTNVFGTYRDILRSTPVWSTFGNHEGFSSVSLLQTGVYYDAFAFPRNGEAGGAPSGTEAYYSFDYANIHFICLNSHDIPRQDFGAMMTWLRADLAQNRQKWTIAYFHHPPYSKGSHDSDNQRIDTPESAASIREMREIALPILESAGVDLVLSGHSHTYERSFLLDGHYGTSNTLTDAMKIDDGDGRVEGDGAYRKTPDVNADSHAGTVYLVPSTGGDVRNGTLDHPVMVESFAINGSMVIDVSGDRLDAKFIDSDPINPSVRDHFTIVKTFARGPVGPTQQPIQDDPYPDQANGVDTDGSYRLSWTYPASPVEQPCGYRIEETTAWSLDFFDNGSESLTAGSNSKWTSSGDWISARHPITGDDGYAVVYTVEQNSPLSQTQSITIPAGRVATLGFDSFEDIERNFDFGFIEISTDGGSTFTTLAAYTGVFSGRRSVDLSAYAGVPIKVRFRLTSDIITAPPQLGWFIDNIRIDSSVLNHIGTTASLQHFDVSGRGNGTYGYRIQGLFGDCSADPQAGPYSASQLITVKLGPPTLAPTASFTSYPEPAEVNSPVSFDAAASFDNDSEGPSPSILNYFWSFGDGTTYSTTSPLTTHTYNSVGIYRVLLVITDNEGETSETEQYIVVDNPQPSEIRATGSGYFLVREKRARFGFEVMKNGNVFSGSLKYHDTAGSLKVDALSIMSVQRFGSSVTFNGTCTINKQGGHTFTVDAVDGSPDTFRIRLSNGYEASGDVTGNVSVGP